MSDSGLWGLLAISLLGTGIWRFAGVLLSGRIRPDSALFNWFYCVAYAMLAGLIMRMILLPESALAGTQLWHRLAAVALGLVVYFGLGRNILAGSFLGMGLFILLHARF